MIGRLVVTAALVTVLVGCDKNVSNTTTTTTAITTTTAATATITAVKNAPKAIGPVVRYDVSAGNDGANGSTAPKEIVVFDKHETHAVNVTDLQRTPVADDKMTKLSNGSGNTAAGIKPPAGKVNITTAAETVPRADITDTNSTTTTSTSTSTNVINSSSIAATETPDVSPANNDPRILHFVPHKYCYCDLICGGCDVNCCCDTDCANDDLKTFTFCSDQATSSVIKPESILFDSSLFYVVIDNVPSDYFYPERNAIETESQVASSMRNRELFTWQDTRTGRHSRAAESAVYNSYDLTYKSLRWMYTVVSEANSSEIKALSLKNSAFNSLCSVEQPVEYLTPKQTHCQTFVSNLTYFCNNDSPFGFNSYYGEKGIFKVVQPVNNNSSSSTVHKTEKFGLVTVRATAHHNCVRTNGSSYDCRVRNDSAGGYQPVYSDGVCRRLVVAVEYRVTHNGTRGVRRVDVHFSHRDVEDAGRPFYVDQRFAVRFAWTATEAEPYERSGKPGYVTGAPVLLQVQSVAARGGGETEKRGRPKPMDLPGPDERGTCEVAAGLRPRVNFRENVDVRCRVRVWRRRSEESAAETAAAELCRRIQNETVSALGNYERVSVASLGDPDEAAWIPVVVVKPPTPPSDVTSCAAITDNVHVRVFYSYVGTFNSPRATVLGVLVNYTASTVATTGVTRAHDNADVEMVAEVPIRATVVFVDLTRPPVRTFAEPPTYEFKLPEDFYYPFWSSNDDGASSATVAVAASRSDVESSIALLANAVLVMSYNFFRTI